jgi:catechol 2,3-dioxygenase
MPGKIIAPSIERGDFSSSKNGAVMDISYFMMNNNSSNAPIISEVSLTVRDLSRSIEFYRTALGFMLHQQDGGTAMIGPPDRTIVRLIEHTSARPVTGTTGLYHFAVLVPTRLDLAHALFHLAETRTPLQGLSDHGVSEAIYLPDPDGNGIEIYCDRAQDEWPRKEEGSLEMVTLPLDTDDLFSFLSENNSPWGGMPAGTILGHVHLHVSDIPAAEHFYTELLGFELVQRYGSSASFLSVNGYHHHIGINTWAGVGAPPPPDNAVGMHDFKISLPGDGMAERFETANWPYEIKDAGLALKDPSGNEIFLAF